MARIESSENGTFSLWLYATSSDGGVAMPVDSLLLFGVSLIRTYIFLNAIDKVRFGEYNNYKYLYLKCFYA